MNKISNPSDHHPSFMGKRFMSPSFHFIFRKMQIHRSCSQIVHFSRSCVLLNPFSLTRVSRSSNIYHRSLPSPTAVTTSKFSSPFSTTVSSATKEEKTTKKRTTKSKTAKATKEDPVSVVPVTNNAATTMNASSSSAKATTTTTTTTSTKGAIPSTPTIPSVSPTSSAASTPLVLPPCPPWLRTCIKYIDKDIIIISKPTGIASQPGGDEPPTGGAAAPGGNNSSTILNTYLPILEQVLLQYNPEKHNLSSVNSLFYNVLNNKDTLSSTSNGAEPLRIVHRLDKDVSGLLILARSKEAAAKLSHNFSVATEKAVGNPLSSSSSSSTCTSTDTVTSPPKIRKRYFALALSPIPTNKDTLYDELGRIQGTCRVPIIRTEWDTQGNVKDQITWSAETHWLGRTVHSDVAKVQTSPYLSLLSLEPITGRRHQLRQHIYAILNETNGILGDSKYRSKGSTGTIPSFILSALSTTNETIPIMLHSYRLSIPAGLLGPHQQKSINIEDELPSHIRTILQLYSVSSGFLSDIIEGNNTNTCTTKRNKGHY